MLLEKELNPLASQGNAKAEYAIRQARVHQVQPLEKGEAGGTE
jgi:hypothetical protein